MIYGSNVWYRPSERGWLDVNFVFPLGSDELIIHVLN